MLNAIFCRAHPRSHLPDYDGRKTWIIEQDGQSVEQKQEHKRLIVDEFATCLQNLYSDVYSNINLSCRMSWREHWGSSRGTLSIYLCKCEIRKTANMIEQQPTLRNA